MPVFDLEAYPKEESSSKFLPLELLAVMYFPSEGDVDEREAFVVEQTRQFLRNAGEDIKSSGSVPEAIVEKFDEIKINLFDLIVSPSLKADLRSLAPEYGAARWITATEIAKRLINALDMNDGTARSRVSRASDVELPRLATEGDIRYARGEALIWIDKQKPARTRDNDADY